ncbi:ArsR/SmtB family transcription factor [Massilia genomosp. 1]|uniref:Helix-turn-helix domain-containing protein n=1 Tax=Massilia genomosp. 1 TaxID=2609280 RepID=A0ABX0MPH9_9BURK|nr:helix-turn-helix transcriptional regulator [Massilia genomosp. 1]NHZ64682.1 helix-turn-helix domain-containing protein [Massilia genomosp. 1]
MQIDAIRKALANPMRRQILGWLKEPRVHFAHQEHKLEVGVCAGLIDARTGLAQSTVPAHLAALQRAGLITGHKVGQWIHYKRNEETIKAFLDQMNQEL